MAPSDEDFKELERRVLHLERARDQANLWALLVEMRLKWGIWPVHRYTWIELAPLFEAFKDKYGAYPFVREEEKNG